MPLSTIFQLLRGGKFSCGENLSTWRKPLTCRKSLTNFITYMERLVILLVTVAFFHLVFVIIALLLRHVGHNAQLKPYQYI
jgi:hypothetical protein